MPGARRARVTVRPSNRQTLFSLFAKAPARVHTSQQKDICGIYRGQLLLHDRARRLHPLFAGVLFKKKEHAHERFEDFLADVRYHGEVGAVRSDNGVIHRGRVRGCMQSPSYSA